MQPISVVFVGLALVGPPALPPEGGSDGLPDVESRDTPAEEAPSTEAPPADQPPAEEVTPSAEPPAEEEAIPVTAGDEDEAGDDDERVDEGAAAGGAAAGGAAAGGGAVGGAAAGGAAAGGGAVGGASAGGGAGGASGGGTGGSGGASGGASGSTAPAPAVQKPGGAAPQQPTPTATPLAKTPTEGPARPDPSGEPDADPSESDAEGDKEEDKPVKKLGGFRLFRIGIAAKIGYTHGTSDKEGLFDREKSIQDSIDNMELTTSGEGDLGQTQFGGFQYGFLLDAEIVGINVWLDFHKFFRPGGMWSLLLGYDHEFGFGKRLRLDVGVAGGLNQVFLGDVLKSLYYDENDPAAVNIGTLGVEGRGMIDLHIKLVGPLYTGPYALLGYHYLWSANTDEVTAEKGLHYSAGWNLRLDFAAPKILGRKR